jgi:hypothetical protein
MSSYKKSKLERLGDVLSTTDFFVSEFNQSAEKDHRGPLNINIGQRIVRARIKMSVTLQNSSGDEYTFH